MKNSREENQQQENQNKNRPEANVTGQNQAGGVSNKANVKGSVDTGQHGTKATASQQQGQGLGSAKDHNKRSGSDSGQNTNKKTR
ncbi:hypothetical protein [Pontibacter vulgaris]|uniref:hypothetical protein n=1 Tax=Pontibacter vulgaris TaxID=2905679 RepID=UPI001FA7C076|nr:hypothetical protein [Pontibacter vulgaris]